ncbi:RNA polymerase sigma factor [Sphingobacterium bovistauri]|uniref:Sigma-70 family RNA polymerase sigma factor n=1 Tax=Sphingobacterium bovistauri TaxID=2781959 RepID=A0ABS7Z9P6_9SPHI|nr:sigma-70 family RNA polymerase sigma factor [Sphingobacterium bovistauri]MCA5005664.1 sigma-70 family RNA polymerase sigma factor [Sphingobacterium bovistauri]
MDNSNIVDQLYHNNQNGLKELYKIYYKPLLYFVMQYVKEKQTAEDIVAETFVKVWEYRHKFLAIEPLRSFLYVTSKNLTLNQLKKASFKYENIDVNSLENEILSDSNILDKIVKTELLKSIFEEVQKLPEKQQQIIRLTFIEEKSIEEICALLKMSESAVYTNRSRAIASLKKMIGKNPILEFLITL